MSKARPKAYLLLGCPFCMRLRIFLSEAGLEDEIEIVAVKLGSDAHHQLLATVEQAGLTPTFPFIEHAPGRFEVESQAIIDRLARERGIDAESLPMLRFYNEGMLPRYSKMFQELKRLKGREWNGSL